MRQDLAAGKTPVAVVASAGTVSTGSIDPLREIAEIAHRNGAWFHIDGAYGALAAIAERDKFAGLELADSISLDPHKWLYQPLDCGCLLYRSSQAAQKAFSHTGDYARSLTADPVEGFAFFEESLELSRRFRALKLWLSLRYHGLAAFRRVDPQGSGAGATARRVHQARASVGTACPGGVKRCVLPPPRDKAAFGGRSQPLQCLAIEARGRARASLSVQRDASRQVLSASLHRESPNDRRRYRQRYSRSPGRGHRSSILKLSGRRGYCRFTVCFSGRFCDDPPDHEAVLAGKQLPAILLHVEDRRDTWARSPPSLPWSRPDSASPCSNPPGASAVQPQLRAGKHRLRPLQPRRVSRCSSP